MKESDSNLARECLYFTRLLLLLSLCRLSSCFSFPMQLLQFPKENDGAVAQGCHCSSDLATKRATISNHRCGTVDFGGGVVIFSSDWRQMVRIVPVRGNPNRRGGGGVTSMLLKAWISVVVGFVDSSTRGVKTARGFTIQKQSTGTTFLYFYLDY